MNNLLISSILLIACIGSVSGQWCYYCQYCPTPFWYDSSSVQEVQSITGYCMKQSYVSTPGALASRGAAAPGFCLSSGRTTGRDSTGRIVYIDCCSRSYCNTGSFTSKSTIAVLIGALALLTVNRYV